MSQPVSLIQNINYLARNLHLLEQGKEMLTPAAVRAITDVMNLPLVSIVEDIKKGVTDTGKRKLDINTTDNYMKEPSSVEYSAITVAGLGSPFVSRHEFPPSHKPRDILVAVRGAIEAFNTEALAQGTPSIDKYCAELVLNECGTKNNEWLVRITDSEGGQTPLMSITLHVAEESQSAAVRTSEDFFWFKSTSSLLLKSGDLYQTNSLLSAPKDGKTYGVKNGEWVALEE